MFYVFALFVGLEVLFYKVGRRPSLEKVHNPRSIPIFDKILVAS